jgi:GntR family transcriptional repressor for pyruvate dehydrogenase complex
MAAPSTPDDLAASGIGPVTRPGQVYEEVVERLLAFVSTAQLQPGDRLPPERQLARDLEVSRSTLRQALTVLRVIGLVDVRHGVGIHLVRPVADRIPPITDAAVIGDERVPAIKDVREALESHAAWLAATRRSDGDLAELAAANEQMAHEIADGGIGIGGDRRFHAAVVTAAHSPRIQEQLGALDGVVRAIATASLSRPDQPPRSLDTHRLIFGAVAAGDADLARQVMLDHLRITGEISDGS